MEIKDVLEFEEKLRNMTVVEIQNNNLRKELTKTYVLCGDILGMIIKRYSPDEDIVNISSNIKRKSRIKQKLQEMKNGK